MKTQPEICKAFDQAVERLTAHDITVNSDGVFVLFRRSVYIASTLSVDGLTAFADALDYAGAK